MLQDVPKLREKVARRAADPQQMRDLTDDGDVDQTFDKATHDGCGDETGYPSHAHEAKEKEKNPDQYSEGRSERIELGRSMGCDGADGQRRDQTGCRIWTNDELARRAE